MVPGPRVVRIRTKMTSRRPRDRIRKLDADHCIRSEHGGEIYLWECVLEHDGSENLHSQRDTGATTEKGVTREHE